MTSLLTDRQTDRHKDKTLLQSHFLLSGGQSCPGVSLPHTEVTYRTCYSEPIPTYSDRVQCDIQPPLPDGRYPSGTQVQLECSSGYGTGVVRVSGCRRNGNWEFSGDPLQCEGDQINTLLPPASEGMGER